MKKMIQPTKKMLKEKVSQLNEAVEHLTHQLTIEDLAVTLKGLTGAMYGALVLQVALLAYQYFA